MAYIMNKPDGDFQQGSHLYKPNSDIMDTQVRPVARKFYWGVLFEGNVDLLFQPTSLGALK